MLRGCITWLRPIQVEKQMSELRVVVTGAGRGIGRAIALRFARAGARVALLARTASELDAVAAEVNAAGGKGLGVPVEVRDLSKVEEAYIRVDHFLDGRIDVLVNNAGVFNIEPIDDLSKESWATTMEVNLYGPYYVVTEFLAALEESERAHIFNVASTAAREGFAGSVAYCASKYGLRGFGDALRLDLADRHIRVSTIYPGATDTSIFDDQPGEWDRSTMNQPEDVAEVIWKAYQASDDVDVDDLDVPKP